MLFAALACKLPIFYFWGLYQPAAPWSSGAYFGSLLLGMVGRQRAAGNRPAGGQRARAVFPVFSRAVLLLDAAITSGAARA